MKEANTYNDLEKIWFDEFWNQISVEKDELITKRLVEQDLYLIYQRDSKRRFKRFQLEKLPDGVEKLWYDDETENGELIICLQTIIASNGKGMFGYQVVEIKK